MTQNLTNVYAYLRKTYPDVDMLFAKPVSYIKSLVEDDTKVVFVYKEVSYYIIACFVVTQCLIL